MMEWETKRVANGKRWRRRGESKVEMGRNRSGEGKHQSDASLTSSMIGAHATTKFDVADSKIGNTISLITSLISLTLTALTLSKINSFQSAGKPRITCRMKLSCAALAMLACPLAIPRTIPLMAPSSANASNSVAPLTNPSMTLLLAVKAANAFGER